MGNNILNIKERKINKIWRPILIFTYVYILRYFIPKRKYISGIALNKYRLSYIIVINRNKLKSIKETLKHEY